MSLFKAVHINIIPLYVNIRRHKLLGLFRVDYHALNKPN